MANFSGLLSVVTVVENGGPDVVPRLRSLAAQVALLAAEHEIIVVDNASRDGTVEALAGLTRGPECLPNLQAFALVRAVDTDTAAFAGIDNAIGDFVFILDLERDDPSMLAAMLDAGMTGSDVVFAENTSRPEEPLPHRMLSALYYRLFAWLNEVRPDRDAPRFRLLSRRVVNYLMQHEQPNVVYRHLPATAGFAKMMLTYASPTAVGRLPSLRQRVATSMRELVASSQTPLRLATTLCAFGAMLNILYSLYVVGVYLFKPDVAPGWTTLSLQQSGMFLLISVVLLLLSEYVLHATSAAMRRPMYHVGREFVSERMGRSRRLNIEEDAAERIPLP
jgi:polyisoprenyl-phosphate glycosyltransferase